MQVRQLGLSDYYDTWHKMQQFTKNRDDNTPDEIWLTQHKSIFTTGIGHKYSSEYIGNIPVVHTDRGGNITYHALGQLMVYLLIDLRRTSLGVKSFVRKLEQSVIDLLDSYGIKAHIKRDAPGVYVDGAKISSIGIKIANFKTYHGLSLNVAMDLKPFSMIAPCGYANLQVVNLSDLSQDVKMADVSKRIVKILCKQLT